MKKVTLFILLSLFTCLLSQAKASTHVLQDIHSYVIKDTAYCEADPFIINRADSMKVSANSFVGPGPASITFFAEMTQQPSYCSWELASDNRFEDIIDQFRIVDASGRTSTFDYDFDVAGTYYVRFVADFQSTTDEGKYSYTTKEPYQIQITESLLEIPNLITPDQPESRNSVFRVRYKSLVSYEIWIHNRWGQQLYHSTDPAEGWDGKSGGSTVPTGAYYYLIKAEGTDGISYNKKGAINVLRTKEKSTL
mgnify:CR=1 FL=1